MPRSPHDTLLEISSQLSALIQEGWEQEVLSQPADYEQQARLTGAFVRTRGLSCVADLLHGLANLSHVAWQKCLRKARSFLLCSRRRQRDHQESTIRRHLFAHFGLLSSFVPVLKLTPMVPPCGRQAHLLPLLYMKTHQPG